MKSSQLVSDLQVQLSSNSDSAQQYLIDTCHVFISLQSRPLTNIATSMLHQLGGLV